MEIFQMRTETLPVASHLPERPFGTRPGGNRHLNGRLAEFSQARLCRPCASVSSSFPSRPCLGGAPLLRWNRSDSASYPIFAPRRGRGTSKLGRTI